MPNNAVQFQANVLRAMTNEHDADVDNARKNNESAEMSEYEKRWDKYKDNLSALEDRLSIPQSNVTPAEISIVNDDFRVLVIQWGVVEPIKTGGWNLDTKKAKTRDLRARVNAHDEAVKKGRANITALQMVEYGKRWDAYIDELKSLEDRLDSTFSVVFEAEIDALAIRLKTFITEWDIVQLDINREKNTKTIEVLEDLNAKLRSGKKPYSDIEFPKSQATAPFVPPANPSPPMKPTPSAPLSTQQTAIIVIAGTVLLLVIVGLVTKSLYGKKHGKR